MANKKFFAGMLVMALVFGIVLVGCSSEEADTWTDVTSLSQLNGKWKGPVNFTETGGDGLTAKYAGDLTYTINASAGTMSISFTGTITFSGNNVDSEWPDIKAQLTEMGFTANDSNHSGTGTGAMGSGPVSLADFRGAQINQTGKKWKLPAGNGSPEIIFTKQ